MELRVLRYFLAVAAAGNLTHGAASLHITQPTLTRQIRDLEEELGCQLFHRTNHSVELTDAGMELREYAQQIVDLAEKAKSQLQHGADNISGWIYIGSGETKAMQGIADVLHGLRNDHPGVRIHLLSGNAQDVMERLDRHLLDFGILIQPADTTRYDHMDLPAKDVWGVIMRKDSPLAELEAVNRESLLDVPLILSRQAMQDTGSPNEFREWFGADVDRLHVAATFNLVYNAAIMVSGGIGYAVAIDGLADTREDSPLCFRPLNPPLESGLTLIWNKHSAFSPPALAFLDRMRAHE